jgi:hypothetical protein
LLDATPATPASEVFPMAIKDKLFGQVAVRKGYITKTDLLDCLRTQILAERVMNKHFLIGEIMFLRGYLSPEHYLELLKAFHIGEEDTDLLVGAPLFGEIVVDQGFVTQDQLLECLDMQELEDRLGRPHRLIGQILLDRGYLTRDQLDAALQFTKDESLHKLRARKEEVVVEEMEREVVVEKEEEKEEEDDKENE